MTSIRADTALAPQPLRQPPGENLAGLPRLRVVPDGFVPPAVRRRRRRRAFRLLVVIAALAVFGVAAAHTRLIESQIRLQQLEEGVAGQEARNQRLRLEVARLESPERIVAAAQERLGMLPPPSVVYLSPDGPVAPVVP
ncbi:MAG TPA: septum formation initiator family protein [Acidimicrobiales bacterium]